MVHLMAQTDLKAEGNAHFKNGQFLKAAGAYTKALKEAPDSAVLYSNRSAALLKLNKVAKALADAEAAVERDPAWDKGHFRKAAALEAQDKLDEALQHYSKAAELNPGNAEVAAKVRLLKRQLGQAPPQKSPTAEAEADPLQQFAQRIIGITKAAAAKDGIHILRNSVYFWPPKSKAGGKEEQMTQVSISSAFDSPQVLEECLAFLRQTAQEQGFTAACAVAVQSQVAYPQVWKRTGWPLPDSQDGIFLQLDSVKTKRLWYLPYKDGLLREPRELKDTFKLVEALFR